LSNIVRTLNNKAMNFMPPHRLGFSFRWGMGLALPLLLIAAVVQGQSIDRLIIEPAQPSEADSLTCIIEHSYANSSWGTDSITYVVGSDTISFWIAAHSNPGGSLPVVVDKRDTLQLPPVPAGGYVSAVYLAGQDCMSTPAGDSTYVDSTYRDTAYYNKPSVSPSPTRRPEASGPPSTRIYPVPAGRTLKIEAPTGAYRHATLYSLSGQKLEGRLLAPGQTNALPLRDVPQGVYLLRLRGEAGTLTRRVMVR
jgi:hypothetical protein